MHIKTATTAPNWIQFYPLTLVRVQCHIISIQQDRKPFLKLHVICSDFDSIFHHSHCPVEKCHRPTDLVGFIVNFPIISFTPLSNLPQSLYSTFTSTPIHFNFCVILFCKNFIATLTWNNFLHVTSIFHELVSAFTILVAFYAISLEWRMDCLPFEWKLQVNSHKWQV